MNFLSENNNTLIAPNRFPMETSNASMLSIDNTTSTTVIMKNENILMKKENAITKNENKVPSNDKLCNNNQNAINQVWTKENFDSHKGIGQKKGTKPNLSLDLNVVRTWANKNNDEDSNDEVKMDKNEFKMETKEEVFSPTPSTPDKETASPSHHARRPMNAFLIFCKKHRPVVRQKFPHLENRGVTRILGEWWALLEPSEKIAYTSLAKEYKDAFFSANPDFKWYKLPAPPLRTLNTRPVSIHKTSSPLSSPTQVTPNSAEFTPGKLADETQLGNLTSLMQANNTNNVTKILDNSNINSNMCETVHSDADDTKSNSFVNNNNNINNNNVENDSELHKQLLTTPIAATMVPSLPPKPIKKRKFEQFGDSDNKKVARNIFNVKPSDDINSEFSTLDQNENSYLREQLHSPEQTENGTNGFPNNEPENMTQQELMNKVVDSMFPQKDDITLNTSPNKNGWNVSKEKLKETRKSGRSCKGRRYAEFMVQGKLLGNKQMKRFTQYKIDVNNKFDNALNNKIENMMHNKTETQTPKLDLGDTIKRLAERTNTKLEDIEEPPEGILTNKNGKRRRTESENSDDSLVKLQSDFNLDLRIAELPSLNYETFLQRKKDSKKRKSIRSKSESSLPKAKVAKLSKSENNSLVGSKKRKNKSSITRLEQPADPNYMNNMNNFNSDLFGLATLAEVAANTEKIN